MLHPDLPAHFPEDATLEHVLPQRPSAKSEWLRLYPNVTSRKAVRELLGNYALLTGKLNTSARNHEFGWGVVESENAGALGQLMHAWTDITVDHITPVLSE